MQEVPGILSGVIRVVRWHDSSRSGLNFPGTVSLELMTVTLPLKIGCFIRTFVFLMYRRNGLKEWIWLLPVLSINVNMDPPPMPILCGFMTEVQSSAAMAPSIADPPLRRISLKDFTHHDSCLSDPLRGDQTVFSFFFLSSWRTFTFL